MTNDAPLQGLRVTSLATNVPGPVAAAKLTALGATVRKVEPPHGDFLAQAAPAWYRALIEGQEVVRIDLKSVDGRTSLQTELALSDVLVLSSRPGALARLQLDRETLRNRYPRLCVVSIVGHVAPDGERAGHDLTYQAEAGLVVPPALPSSLFSDLAAASEAVGSVLGLLLSRVRTGIGGWHDVSLADCARGLAAPLRHGLTRPDGVLGGAFPGYALYQAQDGTIAVAALEAHFLARLLALLQLDAPDPEAMADAFRARSVQHWEAVAAQYDIPLVAVSAVAAAP